MLTREEMERTARTNGHHDVALLLLSLPVGFKTVDDIPPAMLADLLKLQQEIMKCKK